MWEHQVGERVGKLRTDRNMSRAQFGELIGMSEHYVGRIERGSIGLTVETIAKICTATGVSSDYIIFGSLDPDIVVEALNGFSGEQIRITLEIAMKVAQFLNTANGNNLLIQEVLRQQYPASV